MRMYSIAELDDEEKLFQCACRIQDGTEIWVEDTKEKAIYSLIKAAESLNGKTITEEDIYFEPCIPHFTSANIGSGILNLTKNDEPNALVKVIQAVSAEYHRAVSLHGSFSSTHEGYAIIKEELDELWDGIKKNDHRKFLEKEAIQIAAMAIRFCIDIRTV